MKKGNDNKIININWIDDSDRCALIPGYQNYRKIRRLKELKKAKGNCYFSSGISHKLIDFIYRSVKKLGIHDRNLFFSKGAVKAKNMNILNSVKIEELDWDVGISVIIPYRLNYNRKISLLVENNACEVRLMEIIVLIGLLSIAYQKKSAKWYSNMSAAIIARGWDILERDDSPEVLRI